MHVLTKIFIVLVSLLAVLLVPLVVVYAHNEASFKVKYLEATDQVTAAKSDLANASTRLSAEVNSKQIEVDSLSDEVRDVRGNNARLKAEIKSTEARLAAADALKAEINSKLATLSAAVQTAQELNQSLVEEARSLRTDALDSQRRQIELDEALREVSSQLEVAVAARRMLQEELQRAKDAHASAVTTIGQYVALHGNLPDNEVLTGALPPDRDLECTVIRVDRSAGKVTVEVDAGSRDGMKAGWGMSIAHDGVFIGNLRITHVDIDHSVGEVVLEDAARRGETEVGMRAIARKGVR